MFKVRRNVPTPLSRIWCKSAALQKYFPRACRVISNFLALFANKPGAA